jgi:uncharacterized protein involved in response to NO
MALRARYCVPRIWLTVSHSIKRESIIMLNIDDPAIKPPQWALWQLGFRPLFLAGALLAALYIPIWLQAWYWPQHQWLSVMPLWWHPHELLFGFGLAIVAGFLLTAVQTWTNQAGMKGPVLAILVSSWLAARVLLLLPVVELLWFPALFDTLFLLLTAYWMGNSVVKVRQWRNSAFAPLLVLAAAVNLLSYWALATNNFALASQIWQAMIWWLTLMITLVGGRVIPFFTAVKLGLPNRQPWPWLDWSVLLCLGLLFVQMLSQALPKVAESALLLVGGLLQLLRMARWHSHLTLKEPMLWSLHVSYLSIPVAMLGMAVYVGDVYAFRTLMHLLAVGCIGGMCLSMITRVSLGHTGRNIYQGPVYCGIGMSLAFALIALAAVVRGLFPLMWPAQTQIWHWVSGAGWTLAFGLFVFHFFGILNRPRPDGKMG